MKERRSSKYKRPERAVLRFFFSLFCLAGAAAGVWFFREDLNRTYSSSSQQSVGTLSYKRNTVQRRLKDRLAWSMLPGEAPVYNGDLIRTADLSDATITFISGDHIGLTENSLITIGYDEETGETTMELLGGKVSLRSNSGKTVLLAGGKELRLRADSDIEVQGGSGQAEFQAVRGGAVVGGGGETVALDAGQSVSSGPEGVAVIPDALTVLQPLPNQEFRAEDGDVTFMWRNNRLAAGEYVRIEIASGRHFSDIAYSVNEYDAAVNSASVPLTPGIWWWRISRAGSESAGTASTAREGRISVLEPPLPPPPVEAEQPALASPRELAELDPQSLLTIPPRAAEPEPPPEPEAPPAPPPPPPPAPPPVVTLLPRAVNLQPAAGTVIDGNFLAANRTIVFRWNAVAGADAYLCTIRQGTEILRQVYEPRLELDPAGVLVNGPCTWRVEAVTLADDGSIDRRGLAAVGRFTVAVPRPQAPRIDNPGIIYER